MNENTSHSVHIPVLGIGYSIETPLKVARFGISSVLSIMNDELIEKMRAYHCMKANIRYQPINPHDDNCRVNRITAYLNLIRDITNEQVRQLKCAPFKKGSEIEKYFEMLPGNSPVRRLYRKMKSEKNERQRKLIEKQLRKQITPGAIDVNIMAKVDNIQSYDANGQPCIESSDALTALRGFAESKLDSSVVLSAGYNPRLYSYIEQFKDFYPDENGHLKKRIILKVSDFRSALVQGKLLAKKGLWISEFRIESGLNCGGHAFPTEGLLLGPILEEFKSKRAELIRELFGLCNAANVEKGNRQFGHPPKIKITVQGGIGTARENEFLISHYELDGTGWGSPFLLVPEATSVDNYTLQELATAKQDDFFLSASSPLGVPFNNFRNSSAEKQRRMRVTKGRPGSPCYKKYLVSDTEFTSEPICTASRQYQKLKIEQLEQKNLPPSQFEAEFNNITAKDCLCEGLSEPALIKNGIPVPHNLAAVTVCPGPNLAYFSGVFSLPQMMGHIYGRLNILNSLKRPHMFVNELKMYISYLIEQANKSEINVRHKKYLLAFKTNLLDGIDYYCKLVPAIKKETSEYIDMMRQELAQAGKVISALQIPV